MIGEPVAGHLSSRVEVGPHVGQHTPPVQVVVGGPALGGSYRVPGQRPDVLVPKQQRPCSGATVRGGLNGFPHLGDPALQDAGQPARRDEGMVEQCVDDQRDPDVPLPYLRLDRRHQGHHWYDRCAASKASAHLGAGFLDDERWPVSEHDHVPVHPVHAEALLLHQAQGTAQVRQRGIPGVPLREDVISGDSFREAARTDHLQGRILIDPGDIHRVAPHPVAVHDAVEHGLPHRTRGQPPHLGPSESWLSRDVQGSVQGVQALVNHGDLLKQAEPRQITGRPDQLTPFDVKHRQRHVGTVGWAEHQRARAVEVAVQVEYAQPAKQVAGAQFGEVSPIGFRAPLPGPGREVATGGDDRPKGDIRFGPPGGLRHLVITDLTLSALPVLGAVDRGAVSACPPSDPAVNAVDWLAGLGDVQHQKAGSLDGSLLNRRSDVHELVYPVPEPVLVQRRAEQPPAAVLDANDDSASGWRVRHAGDLVGQVLSGFLIVRTAHLEGATGSPPPGFFLEVDVLAFDVTRPRAGGEFAERGIDNGFQVGTRLNLVGTRAKRRHRHPSRDYYQISQCLI